MSAKAFFVKPVRPAPRVLDLLASVSKRAGFAVERGVNSMVIATPNNSVEVHADGSVDGDHTLAVSVRKLLLACAAATAMKEFSDKVKLKYSRAGAVVEARALSVKGKDELEAVAAGPNLLEARGSDRMLYLLPVGLEKSGFSVRELRVEVKRKAP